VRGVTVTDLVIGVDVGTSSSKAVIATATGAPVCEHVSVHDYASPAPLHAEQHASTWFASFRDAVSGAVRKSGAPASSFAGMTISSLYGGSGVPIDAQLEPLGPSLIWLDRRAERQCEELRARGLEQDIERISGNGVDPYFGYTKILWHRDERPEVYSRTRYFLPPASYLIARLTGEVVVDHGSACNLGGVYDWSSRAWAPDMMTALGLNASYFPERLVSNTERCGRLAQSMAQMLDLPEGLPIQCGGVDAVVATLSAGLVEDGDHAAMIGTSMCWGFLHEGPAPVPGHVNMPYVLDGLAYSFSGAATAGALARWHRDLVEAGAGFAAAAPFEIAASSAIYNRLAETARLVPPGSEGLSLLPYFSGERSPLWDSHARGALVGLTLRHGHGHLHRAILESLAYALRHSIEFAGPVARTLKPGLPVVGGAAQSALWLDIIASVTGRAVTASVDAGEAALGDAALAALALGMVDRAGLKAWITRNRSETTHAPDRDDAKVYAAGYLRYRKLYQVLQPYFADSAGKSAS
jgi:ribulokinase